MVLLTMFTCFLVSIATAIITVAMLQVAPETLTQTVNHVVEHTIERIVSGTSTPEKTISVVTNNVTKEVTVYAKEDDLLVAAVDKNQLRTAQIFAAGADSSASPLAIGFVASRDGLIIVETKALLGDVAAKESYQVTVAGKYFSATPIIGQDTTKKLFFLKLSGLNASSTVDSVSYSRGDPKIARTVVVLGGADGSVVFKTSISKFRYQKPDATSTPPSLVGIETSPKIPEQNSGALVVDLDGQAIGIVVTDPNDPTRYIIYPISRILEVVTTIPTQTSDIIIQKGEG